MPQYIFVDDDGTEYCSSPEDSWGETCCLLMLIWVLTMVGMTITLWGAG